MRCPVLLLPDGARRFCQKCNRLHELDRFEGDKRVCRTQLDTFNARRRAQYAQRKSDHAAAALAKRLASRQRKTGKAGDGTDAPGELEPGRLGSSSSSADGEFGTLSDVDLVQLGATVADLFDDDDMLGLSAFPPRLGAPPAPILLSGASSPALAGSADVGGAGSERTGTPADAMASSSDGAEADAAFWWWPLPDTSALCADLKLGGDVAPFSLPASLPDALCGSLGGDGTGGQESLLDFMGAIEPGCVLLTCEALIAGQSRPGAADQALRGLLLAAEADPELDRFLSTACSALTLSGPSLAGVARRSRGGEVMVTHHGGDAPARDSSLVALASPRAQLATDAVTVAVTLHAPDGGPTALLEWAQHGVRARMHGHWLACSVDGISPDGTALLVTMQPPGREGVVMLEPATPATGSAAQHPPRGPPAAVLMTRSPMLAAELNAQTTADPARLHAALLVLGHAVQEAGTRHEVQARAACASLRMGWAHAATDCINALAAAAPDLSATPSAVLPHTSILHEAVASGRLQAVEALMAAAAECRARVGADVADALFGNPGQSRGMMGGYTPLHVCALAPAGRPAAVNGSAEAARLLMGLPADWDSADPHTGRDDAASADAAVTWASVRDDAGRTASQTAGSRHAADPLARLDARIRAQLERARTLALLACGAAQQEDGALALPDTVACAQLRLDGVAEAMAHLTGQPVTPRTVALASALLRDATHAVARMRLPVGFLGRWAARLSLRRAPPAVAAQEAVVVPISEDAWRLARTSLTVHWYLAFMAMYNLGTLLRIPRGTAISMEQLRRHDLFTPAPHWPHTGHSPAIEYSVGGWPALARVGIIDFTAIQALKLEMSTTIMLGAVLLVPRLRAWLTARPRQAGRVSTGRLQAVLSYQLLVHGMLTSSLMNRRTGALFASTRGTIVAWPLHSSIVMLFYAPFIHFCMPAKKAVALPLLALRVVLAIGAWAAPTTFSAVWPVSATAGTVVQLVALCVAAAMVLNRERRLTAEYAALLAAAAAASPKVKSV